MGHDAMDMMPTAPATPLSTGKKTPPSGVKPSSSSFVSPASAPATLLQDPSRDEFGFVKQHQDPLMTALLQREQERQALQDQVQFMKQQLFAKEQARQDCMDQLKAAKQATLKLEQVVDVLKAKLAVSDMQQDQAKSKMNAAMEKVEAMDRLNKDKLELEMEVGRLKNLLDQEREWSMFVQAVVVYVLYCVV